MLLFADHAEGVVWVAYSSDRKYLASCSMDSTAIVYDAETEARVSTLVGHTGGVRAISFSIDSTSQISFVRR